MQTQTAKAMNDEQVIKIILTVLHGHNREQWDNELSEEYPYSEMPNIVRRAFNAGAHAAVEIIDAGVEKWSHENPPIP